MTVRKRQVTKINIFCFQSDSSKSVNIWQRYNWIIKIDIFYSVFLPKTALIGFEMQEMDTKMVAQIQMLIFTEHQFS